jgi:hypothetical protein
MSFSNTTENDILQLLFNKVALSWDANNTVYVALHTADPGEAGVQTTSECAYGSYDRVAVTRNGSGGWTVTGNAITNAALIQFPQCTSSTETVTHVSIGLTDLPTGGQIIAKGALSASLSVSSGIQPQFSAGELDLTLD